MSEKWGSFGAVLEMKNASQLSERHFGEVPSGIGTRKGLERIDTYLIDLQRYVKI